MVANGNRQDPEVHPDHLSPTIVMHLIITFHSISAWTNFKYLKICVIQIGMQGIPGYIKYHSMLTKLIVKGSPGISKFIEKVGMLYCRLLKAFIGCIQARKIFENLSKFLENIGHDHSITNKCKM